MITAQTDSGYQIEIPLFFNGYEILCYLSNGCFSVVLKVQNINNHQIFVAKVISKIDMINKNNLNEIYNEIMIHKFLNHNNIVKLYDSFSIINEKQEELIVIIEEYCKNGDLSIYIKQNSLLNNYDKKRIECGIISAVKYLHHNSIAHCDIKPENILLDHNLNPKLCDFSLSIKCSQYSRHLNLKGDIWSIGITLYIINKKDQKLNKKCDHLSLETSNKKLKNIIEKCTSFNINNRPDIENLYNDGYFSIPDEEKENDCNSIVDSDLDFHYFELSIDFQSKIDMKQNKYKKPKKKNKKKKKLIKYKLIVRCYDDENQNFFVVN